MFERFTESAIKVIMLAQEETRQLGHKFVGTEQILLGLIGEGRSSSWKVLKSAGMSLRATRERVEKHIGRGPGTPTAELPFTPRAKKVLEISWLEARALGQYYIEPGHLLLAITKSGEEGIACKVLAEFGAALENLRNSMISAMTTVTEPRPGIASATAAARQPKTRTPILDECGIAQTSNSQPKRFGKLLHRELQIDCILKILMKRELRNPLLVGEPGVGKSAIVMEE